MSFLSLCSACFVISLTIGRRPVWLSGVPGSFVMSTQKLDHVPELTGIDTYHGWSQAMVLVLQSNALWNHISEGANRLDPLNFARSRPPISISSSDVELDALLKWQSDDAKVRELLLRRMSDTVKSILPSAPLPRSVPVVIASSPSSASGLDSSASLGWEEPDEDSEVTARDFWIHLRSQYDKVDMSAQIALRTSLLALKLKGLSGADEFLGTFNAARKRFANMGVVFDDSECIFLAMNGLPFSVEWNGWRRTIKLIISGAKATATWAWFTAQVYEEIQNQKAVQGVGREVASVALAPRNYSAEKAARAALVCKNPVCGRTGHDTEHCFSPGGGLADAPKPAWYLKGRKGKESAAVVAERAVLPSVEAANLASDPANRTREISMAVVPDADSMPTPAVFASIMAQDLSTLLDSGCTSHLITDQSFFHTYDTAGASNVTTANHGKLPTLARGSCVAIVTHNGRRTRVNLRECLHAPGAVINLLSVGRMVERGFQLLFGDSQVTISSPPSNGCAIIAAGPMSNRLFFLDVEFVRPGNPLPLLISPTPEVASFARVELTKNLWHARMGHAGGHAVDELPKLGTGVVIKPSVLDRCEACIIGKHPRAPHDDRGEDIDYDILGLLHTDMCGPFPVQSPRGESHFMIVLDDNSNFLATVCLPSKDRALEEFRTIVNRWELETGKKVRIMRSDNAGDFLSARFIAYLNEKGIVHQLSCPYSHQQNGKAERCIRTIEDRALTLMYGANLSSTYWADAVNCAGFLFNLSPTRTLPIHVCAYEVFKGRKPDLSFLRVFGCRAFARVPYELQRKGGVKSVLVTFLGYTPGVKGYLVRDVATRRYFNCRDVIFDENLPSMLPIEGTNELPDDVDPPPTRPLGARSTLIPPRDVVRRDRVLTPAGRAVRAELEAASKRLLDLRARREARVKAALEEHVRAEGVSEEAAAAATEQAVVPDEVAGVDGLNELGGDWLADWAGNRDFGSGCDAAPDEFGFITFRSEKVRRPSAPDYDMKLPPATLKEASLRSDWPVWKAAAEKELKTMRDMGVYKLTSLPPGRREIGSRWVLEFKLGPDGELIAKARLVAQGYSQVPGMDYSVNETFAAVTKTSTVRFVAATAARLDWELDTFDATRAFLWGILEEPVYMRQPKGFEEGDGLVWLLYRSVYGLKQASNVWYKKLRELLERLGFRRSAVDHALFIANVMHEAVSVQCLLAVHVDDGLSGSNSRSFLDWVKDEIRKEFGLKDLGPVKTFLGMEFRRNRITSELWISQVQYIDAILAEYGMTDCNPVHTPMDAIHPWGRPTDDLTQFTSMSVSDQKTFYQRLVGHLLFLVLCTRPDGSQTVRLLTQFCSKPEPGHLFAAKRFLRYLAGTRTLALHYGGAGKDDPLRGYCDADWANDPADRVSISGYVWFFAGGPISWSSKKQTTHALASTDAEYMAVTELIREGLWLRSQGIEVAIPFSEPIDCHIDNTGAIAISRKSSGHTRTKHIDVRYHFIREHIDNGRFNPLWVSTSLNVADIFTKSLARPAHTKFVNALSLVPL